jgi:hypothetical protein
MWSKQHLAVKRVENADLNCVDAFLFLVVSSDDENSNFHP